MYISGASRQHVLYQYVDIISDSWIFGIDHALDIFGRVLGGTLSIKLKILFFMKKYRISEDCPDH